MKIEELIIAMINKNFKEPPEGNYIGGFDDNGKNYTALMIMTRGCYIGCISVIDSDVSVNSNNCNLSSCFNLFTATDEKVHEAFKKVFGDLIREQTT